MNAEQRYDVRDDNDVLVLTATMPVIQRIFDFHDAGVERALYQIDRAGRVEMFRNNRRWDAAPYTKFVVLTKAE